MSTEYEVTLPSNAVIVVKPWDLGWANQMVRSKVSASRQETKLLEHCLVRVLDPGPYHLRDDGKLDWDSVLVSDRGPALIATRIVTWGPKLPLNLKCSDNDCRGMLRSPKTPDLEDLKWMAFKATSAPVVDLEALLENDVYELPEESRHKIAAGDNRFETEFHGHRIVFRLMTGGAAAKSEDFVRSGPGEFITRALAARIIELDDIRGENSADQIAKRLETMPASFMELISIMDEHDGGVDDKVDLECGKCGTFYEGITLPFNGSEFWNPSRPKTRTKRKRGR